MSTIEQQLNENKSPLWWPILGHENEEPSEADGHLPDETFPDDHWIWDVDGSGLTGFVTNNSNRSY